MEFLFAIRVTLAQRSAFVLEIRHTYGWFLILLLHCLSSLSELLNHDFASVINIHTWHTWLLLQLHAKRCVPCIAVYFMNVSHSFHFCQNLLVLEMEVESADFVGLSGFRSVAEIHVEIGAARIYGFIFAWVVECTVRFIVACILSALVVDARAHIEIALVAAEERDRTVVAYKAHLAVAARDYRNIGGVGNGHVTKAVTLKIITAVPLDDIGFTCLDACSILEVDVERATLVIEASLVCTVLIGILAINVKFHQITIATEKCADLCATELKWQADGVPFPIFIKGATTQFNSACLTFITRKSCCIVVIIDESYNLVNSGSSSVVKVQTVKSPDVLFKYPLRVVPVSSDVVPCPLLYIPLAI